MVFHVGHLRAPYMFAHFSLAESLYPPVGAAMTTVFRALIKSQKLQTDTLKLCDCKPQTMSQQDLWKAVM